jgi:hypothetical protein
MKNLIISAFFLIALMSNAQVQVDWYNYPGGVAVATDVSNNVYTANWDYNAGGDITLTKRDASGNILWEVPYDNTNPTRHEVATWIETDGSGNILVSGTIRSGYSNPVNANSLLMKFDPSGNLLWRVVYENDFDGSSTRKCLVDANDNIYVLGIGTGPNGQVTKVKKFNSAGVSVWNYFDAGIGGPITFKFTPDNNIIIVHRGITGSINGYSKINLNGNNLWSMGGVPSLSVGDAAGDTYGNTYIINGANPGSILKKLSPTGAVLWSQSNMINGNKVEVGTDNNPVVGGYPGAGYGVALMKYDMNGILLWQNLDADGSNLSLLALAPMKLDGLNATYIAGSTMSSMGLCKVNSDGTSAWAATTPSGYPTCIDFGTDNSVYVTGGTTARFTQSGSVPAPAAPSNLVAIASGTSTINLTWIDNSNNETSFVLQRSLNSASGFTTIVTLAANTVAYSNTGLNSSTTYYYRVQSSNSIGGSSWSNIANATTAISGPPAAPSNLTAISAGCNSIKLTWLDNSGNEANFELLRSTSQNGFYSMVATLPVNTTTFTNTGLIKGRKYYYKVRAINAAGNSSWSNIANAAPKCPQTISIGHLTEEVKLFPNPASGGFVNLVFPSETVFPVTLQIFSLTMQKVVEKELHDLNNTIEIQDLKNGLYILAVTGNGKVVRLKLQITK